MYEVMQIRSGIRKGKMVISLLCFLLLFALTGSAQQKELQEVISLTMQDASLDDVIAAVSKQSKLSFSYDPAVLKNKRITKVQWQDASLQKVLAELNVLTGLEYSVSNNTLAFRIGERPQPAARKGPGKLKGTITDEEDSRPVTGVTIRVGDKAAITDENGAFILFLPKGIYEAGISSVGYGTKKVTGIVIHDDETVTISLPLKREKGQLGAVTVSARKLIETGSNVSMVDEIRNADAVVSGISKEQIARSQDRDAAEVVRRISGVSIIQNRLVVIRGLPQRYNTVMLNNSIAPSFEPDSRAFSFDIMPSGLIDRVMIYKTAVPELPGDFAGGVIKVYTTEIPVTNSFNVNYSASFNTNTTFRNFAEQKKGSKAWLGFDDGTYAIPAATPARVDLLSVAQKRELTPKFNSNWDPISRKAPVDHRFGFDFGQRIALGKTKLGLIGAFSYSNTYQYNVIAQNTASLMGGVFASGFRFSDQSYDHNVRMNGLLNISLQINHRHQLSFKNLYTHTGASNALIRNGATGDAASDGSGLYSGQYVRQYILSNSYRGIYSGQLSGQHKFFAGTQMDWVVAYTKSRYDDPDQRYRTLKQDTALYYNDSSMIEPSPGSMSALYRGRRYFALPEESKTAGLNLVQSFRFIGRDMQVKAGFFFEDKKRTFEYRQLGYEADTETGSHITEIYGKNNSYNAQNNLKAGYLAAEIPITNKLKLYGGIRIEENTQELQTYTWKSVGIENGGRIDLRRNNTSKLPSFNLSYAFSEKNLLRAAFSKTLNRPEFREISTFFYMDMMTYRQAYGNENLKIQTNIDNYDLRFEHYPGPGELFTAGVFYKKFTDPVEFYYYAGTSGYNNFQWNNAKSATSYGAEIELMLGMRRYFHGVNKISRILQQVSVLLNAAYIHSRVDLGSKAGLQDKDRALYGQSPYLINASLNYTNDSIGLKLNAGYNVIGKRLTAIGNLASPNIYEMPRNSLDVNFSQRIAKRVEIKGGIQNILNARAYQIQDAADIKKLADKTDGTIQGNNIFQSEYSGTYFTLGIGLRL